MNRIKLILPMVGMLIVLQAQAAIQYGKESYPAGAGSLRAATFSGPVAPPKLVPSESGTRLKLSGSGGTYGMAKRLGKVRRKGEYLYVSSRIANPTRSFVTVEFQLFNATDRRVLAQGSPVLLRNSESPPVNLSLEYTATKRDVGDLLVLRWIQTSTENPDRSFSLLETRVAGIRPMDIFETFPGGEPHRLKPAVFSGEAALPTLGNSMADADNGDGKGDGAVAVSSRELGGTYGAVWKLGTVEKPGKALHIETVWFAAGSSFVKVDVQLYNATTKTVLARSGPIVAKNSDAPPVNVGLDYVLAATDQGCELEVRWVQTSTEHPSRNFIIDRFSVAESRQQGK